MSENIGVYYNIKDYGSLVRRFIAIAVDIMVLLLLFSIIKILWSYFFTPPDLEAAYIYGATSIIYFEPEFFLLCLAIAYIYLAIMKSRPVKTAGYRLMGLKIVNLKGERPSILQMTWRFFLLTFGPIHILFDMIWLGGDDHRQAIRDKLAGTYVIKNNAVPSGSGPIGYTQYGLFGYQLIFREVKQT